MASSDWVGEGWYQKFVQMVLLEYPRWLLEVITLLKPKRLLQDHRSNRVDILQEAWILLKELLRFIQIITVGSSDHRCPWISDSKLKKITELTLL